MHSLDHVRSARNAAVIALVLTLLPTGGAAAEVPWVVVESRGDVTQQTADGALPVAPGATLAEGAPTRTGADGTLVIAHGNDRVTVSANSAFVLPSGVDPATGPSVFETLGTLLFKVEHMPGRRFEVDTPYLAAVVKGTVFTVSVESTTHMVHVAEGAVEVTASASHHAVLVRPGQTATLASPNGTPSVIDGRSPAAPDGKSEREDAPRDDKRSEATPTPDSVMPDTTADRRTLRLTRTLGDQTLDVAALTNGLVKAGKDAALAAAPDPAAGTDGASVNATPSVGAGNSGATDVSSAAAATAPSVGVTPAGGSSPTVSVNVATPVVSAAAVTVPVAAVPTVVDTVAGVVHAAAATAKLPGANNPLATGRKLP